MHDDEKSVRLFVKVMLLCACVSARVCVRFVVPFIRAPVHLFRCSTTFGEVHDTLESVHVVGTTRRVCGVTAAWG